MANPNQNPALIDHPSGIAPDGSVTFTTPRANQALLGHPRGVTTGGTVRATSPNTQSQLLDHPGANSFVRNQTNMPRFDVFLDRRVANCAGHIVNSNCSGDTQWNPVSANWWTFPGTGGSAGARTSTLFTGQTNPNSGVNVVGSFDFVGGRTTTDEALTQWGVPIYGSYSLINTTTDANIYERTYNNCNCGNNNCVNNCNCNCNCVCVCVCDCTACMCK